MTIADTDDVRVRLLILFQLITATGCLWTPKPYSNDPLVRQRRAALGDPDHPHLMVIAAEPQPPVLPSSTAP